MQLAKMNPRYLPAFIGLGLFLLAMLAACTAPSAVAVPTAEPTPLKISTELSNCVTTITYLATHHTHDPYRSPQLWDLRSRELGPGDMLNHYYGSYIDSQLLEKFSVREYGGVPKKVPGRPITSEEYIATQQAIRDR